MFSWKCDIWTQRRHREKMKWACRGEHHLIESRDQSDVSTRQGTPEIARKPRESRKRHGKWSPCMALRGNQLFPYPQFRLSHQNHEEINLMFKAFCGTLYSRLRKQTSLLFAGQCPRAWNTSFSTMKILIPEQLTFWWRVMDHEP